VLPQQNRAMQSVFPTSSDFDCYLFQVPIQKGQGRYTPALLTWVWSLNNCCSHSLP